MPRTPTQAVAAAKTQSVGKGPQYHEGQCLKAVREALDVPAHDYTNNGRDPWAIEAWDNAQHRHTTGTPPIGVPVFWRGKPGRPGHVALSDGAGMIWTTDAVTDGRFSREPLDWPVKHWGLTYLGWTEDLNGVRVHPSATTEPTKPAAVPTPAKGPTRVTQARGHLVEAQHLILDAAKANKGTRRARLLAHGASLKALLNSLPKR